jgi:hypothetical protein
MAVLSLVLVSPAWAQPPADLLVRLRHGVSITGWFRYPASRDPTALARWMTDDAMADLYHAGFGFVRLAIDPAVAEATGVRDGAIGAVCRLQRHGLAVIVDAHPDGWHLETSPDDRARLRAFWRVMAPALRRCDPRLTLPEILNEPVFPGDPAGWAALQHTILSDIRTALPDSTIVLTGQDWGSVGGLLALTPEHDDNVLYSFHFYDPADLTSLAAYRHDVDRTALARLPFPVTDRVACERMAAADPPTRDLMRYYCAMRWDDAAVARRIGEAAAWARDHHVTLLAGEFGATDAAARLAWLAGVRRALEVSGIGWALWGYDDIMGFSVRRPPVARPLLPDNVLAALGLPRVR